MLRLAGNKLSELETSSAHLNDVFDAIEELCTLRDELEGKRTWIDIDRVIRNRQ